MSLARAYDTDDQVVTQVASKSLAQIEAAALDTLERLAPGFVGRAEPLDVANLVDYGLPKHGIHFVPVEDDELGDHWAYAQCDGDEGDDVEVLVQNTEWQNVHNGGRRAHHGRATFMHELGHVILHVPQIRRRRSRGLGMPRQMRVSQIKRYQNPEWQAYAFGGCMLAPRSSIIASGLRSVAALSITFATSEELMRLHLKRLGLLAIMKEGR
jgi:hypothetical protein